MARKKHRNKFTFLLAALVLLILSVMTMGYARFSKLIDFSGDVGVRAPGDIYFSDVTFVEGYNVTSNPTFTNNTIDFNITFSGNNPVSGDCSGYTHCAVYSITVQNDTFYEQSLIAQPWTPRILDEQGNEVTDAHLEYYSDAFANGNVTVAPGDSFTFNLAIGFHGDPNSTYTVEGDAGVSYVDVNTGALFGEISSSSTGDLRGNNTYAHFQVHVINTYDYAQTFSLALRDNNKFVMTDSSGNALGNFTISGNTDSYYDVYVSKNSNDFPSAYERAGIYLISSEDGDINCGRITLQVDQSAIYTDTTPPQISNVQLAIQNTNGRATASWSATDDITIDHFTVLVYNSSDTLVKTVNTSDDSTSATIDGLSEGSYYVKVYGIDAAGNSGEGSINQCTTSAGPCSRSSGTVAMKWVFSVTRNLTNLSSTGGGNSINRGATYSMTLTAPSGYKLPAASDVTVTMGGQTVSDAYTQSTGVVRVTNVTGDIVVTAAGVRDNGCLLEGTEIRLADGSSKKVEDITYTDLLAVWNYETGKLDAAYPIWIERKHTAAVYQRTRFADGSELRTVREHGLFNADANLFVSILNPAMKPGTHITKVDEAGKLVTTKIVSQESVPETANYYHVVTARYYNIIANGFITTDGTVALSNLYGFGKNITWPATRAQLLADPANLVDYSAFSDFVPKYMYDGMRMGEIGVLINYGAFSLNDFRDYLLGNQVSPRMMTKPELENFDITHLEQPEIYQNRRLWPVSFGAKQRLVAEGQRIVLPEQSGVVAWHNSVDGEDYLPGAIVEIKCGTHFTPLNSYK